MEPFLIVVPCVISAAWLVLIFLVRELYSEFGCDSVSCPFRLLLNSLLVGLYSTLLEQILVQKVGSFFFYEGQFLIYETLAMYQWYQIMICLLKFDFFCFTALTMQVSRYAQIDFDLYLLYVQLLIVVLSRNSAEFGLTIAAIPIVLLLLVLCGISVKQEIKWFETLRFLSKEQMAHILNQDHVNFISSYVGCRSIL